MFVVDIWLSILKESCTQSFFFGNISMFNCITMLKIASKLPLVTK